MTPYPARRSRTLLLLSLAGSALAPAEAFASMSFSATPTQLSIYVTANLPGSAGGRSWTALVGPVRSRDKKLIVGPPTYAFAGQACQATIFGCKPTPWATVESAWVQAFGASSMTAPRLDINDWQPGDQVCEGTAHVESYLPSWLPAPANITLTGYCYALPDPRPVQPVSCSVALPSPLAHGDMTASQVNGRVASTDLAISCSRATTVHIRAVLGTTQLTSKVPVRADGSIAATLTINGADGATGASVPVSTTTTFRLASTLASEAPTPGTLQGNAVLIVDIP
ncbi:hypothetical protein [Luteibacter sp. dw_328]|uniref:MrpH family fimbial adhesin n=1 Tax=Luteibacter sp. dw_328 TaxID=2719796 RepID=UPI001BD36EC6|nr:hypothetical protein [Luteibacter sp. dw_328]